MTDLTLINEQKKSDLKIVAINTKKNTKFLPFEEAREFVRSLNFSSIKNYTNWIRENKSQNIPLRPESVYKKYWISWADWLNVTIIANQNRIYRSFEEARTFVRSLGFNNGAAYLEWAKSKNRPSDIPFKPNHAYKNFWISWGDWLGTNYVATTNREYRPFIEAKDFARSLKLNGKENWAQWAKSELKPDDIPANPLSPYKKEWMGWGDWLGTGNSKNKNYLPFEDARKFVRSLNFNSREEWLEWAKKNHPKNIPSYPNDVYKKHWLGWSDWIGRNIYRDFEEARKFSRSLGLNNSDEWKEWVNTNKKPKDIPLNPKAIYKIEWISWKDWLGVKKKQYRSFEDARMFVRALNLNGQNYWREWLKKNERPNDIPAKPERIYKLHWIGWGDWLGTGFVAHKDREYRSFEEARSFVKSLKLNGQRQWQEWLKEKKRPQDIPANPPSVYKDQWKGWGDWLGTNSVAPKDKVFRPFKDARIFVRSLSLKDQNQWNEWARSEDKPADIPITPWHIYKEQWLGLPDWIGSENIATCNRSYRSFEEAREYVRALKLNGQMQWQEFVRNNDKPQDIPSTPWHVYKEQWVGWGDWLGCIHIWTKPAILGFLKDIEPNLSSLKPTELYVIMSKNGMLASLKTNTSSKSLLKSLRDFCASQNFQKIEDTIFNKNFNQETNHTDSHTDFAYDINCQENEVNEIGTEDFHNVNQDDNFLPTLSKLEDLDSIDSLIASNIISESDEEMIEFLISNRVSDQWQNILEDEVVPDLNDHPFVEKLRKKTGNTYFQIIKNRFLQQYDGAKSIPIPNEYNFKLKETDTTISQPQLMQRLTAYRLIQEKRIGNWSGVGAGKTLSAILSSRLINAKYTVIIGFNSTIDNWEYNIKKVFPASHVIQKEASKKLTISHKLPNYILLNFEKFQQSNSQQIINELLENHIDFIVLDEIQSVKQRDKNESKRRLLVKSLLIKAQENNPNLNLLGMSATPVINTLFEGKALLELVTGVEFSELNTTNTIENAISLHQKLMLHGIRYRPKYPSPKIECLEIDGQHLLNQFQNQKMKTTLEIEQILLQAKLSNLENIIKKGTLIYSHYKEDLLPHIETKLRILGFSVGYYTGDNKNGLQAFLDGKIDILIGTSPIGTGVDGLQKVCNRLIILCLPWTAAEYEQLIGRLCRQGLAFIAVEVFIPQVVIKYAEKEWSYDKEKLGRIQYKKTLADAAMDGIIPEGRLESPETMLKKSQKALQDLIKRIEEDGILSFSREKLKIPLPNDLTPKLIRHYGDFTAMNARINTSLSQTTHDRFLKNPDEWYLYHTLYREARETWSEVPYEKIAAVLKQRPDWVIGDFGCGEAKLAELLTNKVYSYDHVAINENVIACDISSVPLADGILDVVVFSLSLMGSNFDQYLKEANRTLKFGGLLKIVEPKGRWCDSISELMQKIRLNGFQISGEPAHSDQFVYINGIKL